MTMISRIPYTLRSLNLRKLGLTALIALSISACGPLIDVGGKGAPPSLYSLSPADVSASPASLSDQTLIVAEPEAFAVLDTRKIALMPESREFSFYAGAEWVDRAPRMIQSLLITSFEEAGIFKDVGAENMPLAASYRLTIGLRAFNTDYTVQNGPVVKVTMMARLFKTRALDLVDSKLITVSLPVGSDSMAKIIATFDRANRQAMTEIVNWTIESISGPGPDSEADQSTAP